MDNVSDWLWLASFGLFALAVFGIFGGRLVLGLVAGAIGALVLVTPNGTLLIAGTVAIGVSYLMAKVALNAGAHYDISVYGDNDTVEIHNEK
jgi:hypothetical protein